MELIEEIQANPDQVSQTSIFNSINSFVAQENWSISELGMITKRIR